MPSSTVSRCVLVMAWSCPAVVPILAQTSPPSFDVDSPVLTERQMMPREYTPDGRNLAISEFPN